MGASPCGVCSASYYANISMNPPVPHELNVAIKNNK